MAIQFSCIPIEVGSRRDLTPAAHALILAVMFHGRNGNLRAKVETLAKTANYSCRSVHRALTELKAAGLIDWSRTGRSSRYWLKGALLSMVCKITRALVSGSRFIRQIFTESRSDRRVRNTEEGTTTHAAVRPEVAL